MASSRAQSVEEYLDELPAERREVIAAVRDMIIRHLPKGYQETMNWGMICYEIPLRDYPETYNKQPLSYVALAAQKHYYALYMTGSYAPEGESEKIREAFEKEGKKLDMGKACIRFKKLEDIPLKALGTIIAGVPPKKLIAAYEESRKR